jgi:hypothetical protein
MKRTTRIAFKKQLPDAHLQLAREKSALLIADMAMARWTSGDSHDQLQLAQALRPSKLSQWHETVQLNFSAWLAAGGFAASELASPSDTVSQSGSPALEAAQGSAAHLALLSNCH